MFFVQCQQVTALSEMTALAANTVFVLTAAEKVLCKHGVSRGKIKIKTFSLSRRRSPLRSAPPCAELYVS
jgi:hypothetical protein